MNVLDGMGTDFMRRWDEIPNNLIEATFLYVEDAFLATKILGGLENPPSCGTVSIKPRLTALVRERPSFAPDIE